jgi:DNA-binding transcriptional LysR family regulator
VLLLRRHARGVAATAAGEALARHARVVLHQLDALRRDIAGPAAQDANHTVLLANSSALARPLHRVIGDVLAQHAGTRLSARESGSEVTVHALHSGAAHVGLVTDAAGTDGLIVNELGADPLVVIASIGHPLAARSSLRFAELLAHDWVAWDEGNALHTHLAMQAYRGGGTLRAAVSVPSAVGVVGLVARGLGISVLPQALLHRADPRFAVAALKLDETWAQRKLLVCRSAKTRTPVALALFDAFKAQWGALEACLRERDVA